MKKISSLILTLAIMVQTIPVFASNNQYVDIENHWAKNAIEQWSDYGIINGYNHQFRPSDSITRGEMAVIIDRIMAYEQKASNHFVDLDESFYTDAILKANRAGIIQGSGDAVSPRHNVTREQASVMIARALHFDTTGSEQTNFQDDASISHWAKSSVSVLSEKGIVRGNDKNNFAPKSNITRAEVVTMLDNAIGLFANVEDEYTKDVDGNVVINESGITLKNMDIEGDLIIAEGVADGSVYLDNVHIKGNFTVKGGGKNSIYLKNVTIENAMTVHRDNNTVRIVIEDKTKTPVIEIGDNVIIDAVGLDRELTVTKVVINGGSEVQLNGKFDTVENNVPDMELTVDGDISTIIMEEGGKINGHNIRPGTILDKVPDGNDTGILQPEIDQFQITADHIINGSVSFNKRKAEASEIVTITATADTDYILDTLTVTNSDTHGEIAVHNNQFTMPASDVLVSATFGYIGEIPLESIELKDVENVNLYMMNGNTVVPVNHIQISTFNKNKYLAEVTMEHMPKFYANISSANVVDNEFILNLSYKNSVSYSDGEKLNHMQVPFGAVSGNTVSNYSFQDIVEIIKANPNADVTLTQDVDANDMDFTTGKIMDVDFTGTFNGNGHKISNLDRPMFRSITGGSVTNLVLDNGKTTSGFLLAGTITNATVKNVHIKHSNISGGGGTGAFASASAGTTVIEASSISNTNVTGGKRTGGFVGITNDHFTMKNSYITGNVTINSDAAGGMIGQVGGTATIENSYADITFNVNGNWAHGAMVGYADGANVILKNSISLAHGAHGKRIIGSGGMTPTNSYEIAESKLVSNARTGITAISENSVTDDFLLNQLHWDKNIWKMPNNTSNTMPMLNNADFADFENASTEAKPENPDVYIPQIDRLKALPDYTASQEIAYHNMHILMPFYDASIYVEHGNNIAKDDILNTAKIKTILAFNSTGDLMSGLNTTNHDEIAKIKIVFENEQIAAYDVTFNELLGDVATYTVDSLPIGYNYGKFVLNTSISLVDEIIASASAMDYKTQIAAVTTEEESRLYVDYYNESVKPNVDEVVMKIMQSEEDYTIYLDNDILNAKIKQDLTQNNQLAKILYTYNYYDKWYGFNIGTVKLSDVMFFNVTNMINENYNIKKLVANTVNTSSKNRDTTNTILYYNSFMKPQTNKDMKPFLEYYINLLAGYDNADDWFTDGFQGILKERGVKGKEDVIHYRAWDLMNTKSFLLLPILTAPQEDMYIISVPSQFMIGSLNRYPQHLNGDQITIEAMVESYANQMSNFYNTSSSFINDSATILNSKVVVNYDTRFFFPKIGNQEPGKTEDPVIKWVYEAIRSFAPLNHSGAYADGTSVYWVQFAALPNYWAFSHETAHNQAGYYFYEGKGRRYDTWAEDHADGNIKQAPGDGHFVFNLSNDYSVESAISTNLTLDRINSPEKIHSYYKEMFETLYVLDYLTGQAFLKLTPEQQSRVATQAVDASGHVEYKVLSGAEFAAMNLKTMEDLWDNKIILRGAGANGKETYGEDNHYSINWYQPHADGGRPNSNTFKRLGFEMLGVAGYTDGYVTYRSQMSGNDLDALRKVTGNPENTWKDYKMDRYDTVAANLKSIPYFDSNEVIDLYSEALVKDAVAGNRNNADNVRRALYAMVKRVTNDFETDTIYSFDHAQIVEITTAEELISAVSNNNIGTYQLVSDLDFASIHVADKEAYITDTFLGMIDGNGFQITGLTKPLFQKTMYAYIKNVNIASPVYGVETQASIMIEGHSSILENISILDANISVPFIKNNHKCVELGDVSNQIQVKTISTVEDLNAINEDKTTLTRKMNYKLANDIDVSWISGRDAIITGEFLGEIDGNGFTMSDGTIPLFENLHGTAKNIKFDQMNVTSANSSGSIGVLAKTTDHATVENIMLNHIQITGVSNVASLIGIAKNSKIHRITATNINIKGSGVYVGGLIGRSYDSHISNIVAQGEITVTSTHNGGIVGAVKNTNLSNVYGNVKVNRPRSTDSRNKNGGLIGTFEDKKGSIKNSVSVNDVSPNVYKVISAMDASDVEDIKNNLTNVYEFSDTTGLSNANGEKNVSVISDIQLKDSAFYTNTLQWSSEIWDLTQVSGGAMPVLK